MSDSTEGLTPERFAIGFLASEAAKPYLAGERDLDSCLEEFFAGLNLGAATTYHLNQIAAAVDRIRPSV